MTTHSGGYMPSGTVPVGVPTNAPTPGVTTGFVRPPPGAPTGPNMDPSSLALQIMQLANDGQQGPAQMPVVPSPNDTSHLQTAGVTGAPAAPSTFGTPQHAEPSHVQTGQSQRDHSQPQHSDAQQSHPRNAHARAQQTSPSSPFDMPLSFGALDFSSLHSLFNVPLLDSHQPAHARAPQPLAPNSDKHHQFEHEPHRVTPVDRPRGGAFDPNMVRAQFPILQQRVNGKPLVWLDNAATTQKPQAVIDRLSHFYQYENSNIHRAAHTLAARATTAYEGARESVARFVNARSSKDVIFVRGATEGINLVAKSWGARHVKKGDEIVITWLEHHANIVPWQQLCAETGAHLRVAPVDDHGQIILDEYEKLLGPKTRIVSITQVSNALGTITPAQEMVALAHRHGAVVLVDGAQAVSHKSVDVQALGCDFYVFSGHKVFAPTGIGAVIASHELMDETPPWQGGGNMIQDVTFEKTVYQPSPGRFEAGTGNIGDAVGLGAALDWLTGLGLHNVERYEHGLLEYATDKLSSVPGIRFIGTAREKAGVISFTLDGQKTEELSGILDRDGIAVRSGHHCAQPILRRFGVEATVRASLAPYNTVDDIDALCAALHRLQLGRPQIGRPR